MVILFFIDIVCESLKFRLTELYHNLKILMHKNMYLI